MSTEKKSEMQVQLDEETAQGIYINMTMVNHTETEFVFDFIYMQPMQSQAKVRTRIISSPKHTKRLMLALRDNLEKYEKKFGIVDISTPSPEGEAVH